MSEVLKVSMNDIELVIKIDKDLYERISQRFKYHHISDLWLDDYSRVGVAVKNGTPLPKGHGNLIQREDAEAIFKNARKALYEQSRKERINDFQTRELMLLNAEQFVHLIQPIIKADTESEGKE